MPDTFATGAASSQQQQQSNDLIGEVVREDEEDEGRDKLGDTVAAASTTASTTPATTGSAINGRFRIANADLHRVKGQQNFHHRQQQQQLARSNITMHWKPYFLRSLQDGKFDNHQLKWSEDLPKHILVIKKPDPCILPAFIELITHLVEDLSMQVYVEKGTIAECCSSNHTPAFQSVANQLKPFAYARASFTDKMIDLIICLGGDGTLLYATSMFPADVPPILAFHLGTLGFLTPHRFENFKQDIQQVITGQSYFTMRSRLQCSLYKESTDTVCESQVLNEVVVDRGPSGNLCILDMMIEDQTVTTVQGDGLIISTPTGSTAYAMAAGANMLHPSVPALLIAPICPHSLSFRPVILPASTSVKVKLASSARSTAWVSFDGRSRQELLPGDAVSITTSNYMVPSISASSPLQDWFSGLAECFHWNVRNVTGSASTCCDAATVAANAAAAATTGSDKDGEGGKMRRE